MGWTSSADWGQGQSPGLVAYLCFVLRPQREYPPPTSSGKDSLAPEHMH